MALCTLLLQTTPCLWAQNVVKERLNAVLNALVEVTGKVGCRWRVMPGKVFHTSWRDGLGALFLMPCSVLLVVLPQQEHDPQKQSRWDKAGGNFLCLTWRKVVWMLKVIEVSYWGLSNQPLGIGHINLLYAYESLFQRVLLFCFCLRCRKEWSAGVWSIHGIWMAWSLIGMKIILWCFRACQEKKERKNSQKTRSAL